MYNNLAVISRVSRRVLTQVLSGGEARGEPRRRGSDVTRGEEGTAARGE